MLTIADRLASLPSVKRMIGAQCVIGLIVMLGTSDWGTPNPSNTGRQHCALTASAHLASDSGPPDWRPETADRLPR